MSILKDNPSTSLMHSFFASFLLSVFSTSLAHLLPSLNTYLLLSFFSSLFNCLIPFFLSNYHLWFLPSFPPEFLHSFHNYLITFHFSCLLAPYLPPHFPCLLHSFLSSFIPSFISSFFHSFIHSCITFSFSYLLTNLFLWQSDIDMMITWHYSSLYINRNTFLYYNFS